MDFMVVPIYIYIYICIGTIFHKHIVYLFAVSSAEQSCAEWNITWSDRKSSVKWCEQIWCCGSNHELSVDSSNCNAAYLLLLVLRSWFSWFLWDVDHRDNRPSARWEINFYYSVEHRGNERHGAFARPELLYGTAARLTSAIIKSGGWNIGDRDRWSSLFQSIKIRFSLIINRILITKIVIVDHQWSHFLCHRRNTIFYF